MSERVIAALKCLEPPELLVQVCCRIKFVQDLSRVITQRKTIL